MYLEIVSPEEVLFASEVDSIYAPGVNGDFQMLNNHAPIVSVLTSGILKVEAPKVTGESISNKITVNGNIYSLEISSGTVELKDNKAIILVD